MKFHIGAFVVGIVTTVIIHHSMAAKMENSEEYIYIDDDLIASIQADIGMDARYLDILEASPKELTRLQRQLHNREADVKNKQKLPEEKDFFWSSNRWVQRMTCADSPEFAKPVNTSITSRYGRRSNPFNGHTHIHAGIDFRGEIGHPVLASDSGIVSWSDKKGRYGKTVVISHKNGFTTLYGHLTDYAVKLGDRVVKGQTVGYIGKTGKVTGPHLHFEVRCYNVPVNPTAYLNNKGQEALVSVVRKHFPRAERYVSHTEATTYLPSRQDIVNSRKQANVTTLLEMRSRAF